MTPFDAYIDGIPADRKAALQHIREIVHEVEPSVEEVITYGMPGFKYRGKYLLSFGNFKNHLSLFPGGQPLADLEAQLTPYRASKGTLQFTPEQPIPDDVLAAIIQHCLDRIN